MSDEKKLPKVYIFRNAVLANGDIHVIAAADDGEVLADHICSSMRWAEHDLHEIPSRWSAYNTKFGGYGDAFYEIVIVEPGKHLPDDLDIKITAWIKQELEKKASQ